MAAGRPSLLYWDSCIFIAWIKDEVRPPGEMEGVAEMVKAIEAGRATIMTSVMTTVEILESRLTNGQRAKLDQVFRRREVQKIACDDRVAAKGSEIRDYYDQRGQKLLAPDSLHLATAILYRADWFFTFDGSSGQRIKRNCLTLAPLDGDVAGYPLKIRVPHAEPTLLSGIPPTRLSGPKR